mmetsp:Transcript_4778/g.7094  ORF Transcript_4778/g.7094 Transcript_4778/m.7094 type:complete len:123 (+) Transcript_4778:1000-1368(+)
MKPPPTQIIRIIRTLIIHAVEAAVVEVEEEDATDEVATAEVATAEATEEITVEIIEETTVEAAVAVVTPATEIVELNVHTVNTPTIGMTTETNPEIQNTRTALHVEKITRFGNVHTEELWQV